METDQMTGTTPEAGQVLVQMYQLLWQAHGEAYQRFHTDPKDLVSADLTFILYDLYGRVLDLIPRPFVTHSRIARKSQAPTRSSWPGRRSC